MEERLNLNNKIGCLVIHGFGGNVDEVRPLVSRLTALGYEVLAPSLKGHTGKRKDLKRVHYTDWISSAETALLSLLNSCENVYVIGFSMGGLIAVNLGLKHRLAGIVTINAPIYYWNLKRIVAGIAYDISKRNLENFRRYLKSSVKFPLSALVNFRLLLNSTKVKLKDLKCPIFILQAINDDTVRKNSADYLFNRVGSEAKQLKFYDSADHLLLWSPQAEEVIEDVIDFIMMN